VRGELDTSLLGRLAVPPPPDPSSEVLAAAARLLGGGDGRAALAAPARAAFPDPFADGSFRVLG
jgi:hypothetical protein